MEPVIDDPFPILAAISLPIEFYLLNGVALTLLLALSGLISGSEVAFFSFTHDQIIQFKSSGDRKQIQISDLLKDPKRLLATILIVNNLVNIFIVTLATFATWQMVGKEGSVIVILSTITTLIIIFFGEIIPKIFANHNGLLFAKRTAGLINISYWFFKPIAWILMNLSDLVERRMQKKGFQLSVEEMNEALEISVNKEEVSEEEKGILKGIVNFGTLSVKQIMKSRMDIRAFDIETDFHELMNQINKSGYSRIPIYTETIDKVEGILYTKDLLPHLDNDEDFTWQELIRQPAYFVPESKKIDDLFRDFQEKQVHMAIVIDEYGGTSGLVTMEDVIEEIVGEINDEFDDESDVAYSKLDNNTFIFEGKTSLNDFCKIVGQEADLFDEVKGESESLGGLILELNGKLPHSGEKLTYGHFLFTVTAVDPKRIKKIKVYIKPDQTVVDVH